MQYYINNKFLYAGYLFGILQCCFCKPSSRGSSVTGSTLNQWNSQTSGGVWARLKQDLWDSGVLINLLSFGIALCAMVYATISSYRGDTHILLSLAWPPVLHLCYLILSSNWIPIACTFSPPMWTNPMTLAMSPGKMDSYTMFTRPDLQAPLRPPRRPLGYANHQILVPVTLITLTLAIILL